MEANDERRGKKPTYATGRQVREAFPAAEEEAVQELEERLEQMEREKEELKIENEGMKNENDQLKAEKEHRQHEKEELMTCVAKLEAQLREMGGGQEEQEKDEQPEVDEELEVDEGPQVDEEPVLGVSEVVLLHNEPVMKEVNMETEPVLQQVNQEPGMVEGQVMETGDWRTGADKTMQAELDEDGLDLVLSEEEDNMELEAMLEDVLQVQPPLRRSTRKSPSTRRREQQADMEAKLLVVDDTQHGFKIQTIPGKGRAVVATRSFVKGEFVLEYDGILMDKGTASNMENSYSLDVSKGCFMFYFLYNKKQYCLDATEESGRYGRLINHSRKRPTCYPKVVTVNGTPRLIFRAKSDLMPGQEVQYDYGDRSAKSILAFPWLAE
jgi:histone-lysine N-methyltransferase SETD8